MSKILADLKNLFCAQNPLFWNLKSDFFPIKKVFPKTANNKKISHIKLIMSEILEDLKNLLGSLGRDITTRYARGRLGGGCRS